MADKLKSSALRGEVNIQELLNMSSKERRDFFTKHTDKQLGKFINTEFEKAIVSKQQQALTDWARSTFSPEFKKSPAYQNVIDKINTLDDLGVLDPKSKKAFLEDLVSDKLGISPSPDEIRIISQKAKAIDEAQTRLGDNIGNPARLEENIAFFSAKRDMDKYLQALSPTSNLRVLTGTIGRGSMLASIKSPILNIGSNIEVGLTEAIVRRIAGRNIRGLDNNLAKDYRKMANEVYNKTGYDISRMQSIADGGTSGSRVVDDVAHAEGKGTIRKYGRVVEDIVFKKLMGKPDVIFGARHFADSVNLNALKFADGDGKLAREIMEDAMRIEPQTAKGKLLRDQGVLDAQYATWTNESYASKLSLGMRKVLNDITGDFRVGDYLVPFAKTPANVISTGFDYAGGGIVKALVKAYKGVKSGELGDRDTIMGISRDLTRAGLGTTAAAVIVSQIDSDNFVGAYDPARKQIEELRNSNTNSVKIGDKWISLDWFGPLSVPMSGMLYAKKYGKNPEEAAVRFAEGVGTSALNLPGVKEIGEATHYWTENKDQSSDELKKSSGNYIIDELSSRLIPSIISDIARSLDPHERKAEKGVESVQAKIPGLRQNLPVKQNIFGEDMTSEGFSRILFGSRVKTDKETPVVKELERVASSNDKGLSFTDWTNTSSKAIAQFKGAVGQENFEKAKDTYGNTLRTNLESVFDSNEYKSADDAGKLKLINDQDIKAMNSVFKIYNFKYKKS